MRGCTAGGVWGPGGYAGGLYRVLPSAKDVPTKRRHVQRSGPRKPQGAGVGGTCCSAHGRPHPPLRGPVLPVPGTPWCSSSRCPSRLIEARIDLIFHKVSINGQVSPKSVQKAYVSPYIPNGSRKSPLDILRFPICSAFSHKELMVPFCSGSGLYCQNDEVSTVRTQWLSRERGGQIPPRHRAASCSCGAAPHLA